MSEPVISTCSGTSCGLVWAIWACATVCAFALLSANSEADPRRRVDSLCVFGLIVPPSERQIGTRLSHCKAGHHLRLAPPATVSRWIQWGLQGLRPCAD